MLISLSASAADVGPFVVLERDSSIITDLRYENGNVWIKLAPAHTSDTITVRISNRNKDFYRPWFHGEIDLVSTGFRGNGVWSDRLQTEANYIEYWLNDVMILHLERK